MEKYIPPFSITNKMLFLTSSIMEKIGRIDSLDNLNKYPVLRKQNRIKSIHSSCAIEANSLTLDQVSDVINGVKVIGPMKDIVEVQNAIEAYDKIEITDPLDEEQLKAIHYVFGKGVVSYPGEYRPGNEGVKDEKGNVIFVAPPGPMVPINMKNLFDWMNQEFDNVNTLILSSVFHYEFVFIHPFSDGNGRVARFWQNALLGKWKKIFYWLPIESQIKKFQEDYYKAIAKAHVDGNSNCFIEFMLEMIDKTLNELIKDKEQLDHGVSIYLNKLLKKMKPNFWYTSNEVLELLNLRSKETLRKNYLNPAIEAKMMVLEYPDTPKTRKQRYKLIR